MNEASKQSCRKRRRRSFEIVGHHGPFHLHRRLQKIIILFRKREEKHVAPIHTYTRGYKSTHSFMLYSPLLEVFFFFFFLKQKFPLPPLANNLLNG
jgi:hypothetical protein